MRSMPVSYTHLDVYKRQGQDQAVIEVGGVGYLVQTSSRALSTLAVGAAAFLLVETQVREDAITLYGCLLYTSRCV